MSYYNSHKKSNPKHHNYGRSQSFSTKFAARLSWLSLTLKGNSGNIFSSIAQVQMVTAMPEYAKLPESLRVRMAELIAESRTLAARCNELSYEIGDFNAKKRYMK
jgi:hypothetical protein